MAFDISGTGDHAIAAGTGALHLDLTTIAPSSGVGRAHPVARYDVGLIRFTDGTGYSATFPVVGGPQWVGVPQGATGISYAIFDTNVVHVVEVAGANPFAGAADLSQLLDVDVTGATNGQVLTWNAAASKWEPTTVSGGGGGGLYSAYILARDQEANGTAGGAAAAASWNTRVLNTLVTDSGGIAALAGNALTLPAGTYDVLATAPAYNVNRHKLRLYNVTDAAALLYGQNAYSGNSSQVHAILEGSFVIGASKAIRLDHYIEQNNSANDEGVAVSAAGIGEVYANLEVWKRT